MIPNLKKNSIWAILEVIGSALTLFLLYRVVLEILGIEALGIWALIMATTSLGKLADIGTSAGLSRFIALAQAKNELSKEVDYCETAFLTNLVLYSCIALLLWIPAYYGLEHVMGPDVLQQGRELLPYALLSFALMGVSQVITGSIIGQHHSDQKSIIILAGFLVQFFMAALLTANYGIIALAWAQITQYLLVIISGWFVFLHNHFGRWVFRLPLRWRFSTLKELLSFGLKLQTVTVVTLLFEPIIKFSMSAWGGVEAVGFYEMALRLIMKVRQLIIMPIQPLVPSFAHLAQVSPKKIGSLYYKTMSLIIGIGVPLLLSIILVSPLISFIWIGHIEPSFIFFMNILAIGWLVNLLVAPSYFMGIGTGYVKGNFWGACITTVGGLIFAYIFGYMAGSYGVALAAGTMLAAGALTTQRMNCRVAKLKGFPYSKKVIETWKEIIKKGVSIYENRKK